jgi:hypothetical protein
MNQDHLSEGELAAFLDGGLEAEARQRVVRHLDACTECRAEWIAVGALTGTPRSTGKKSWQGWWVPATLAVAAGLAGLVLSGVPATSPPEETQRAPITGTADAAPRIVAVAPHDGAARNSADRVFTWRAYAAESYRFLLLADDGTPLWTIETQDTSVLLPPEIQLVTGRTYFWRVDAVADGITSSTGTLRLQVTP